MRLHAGDTKKSHIAILHTLEMAKNYGTQNCPKLKNFAGTGFFKVT